MFKCSCCIFHNITLFVTIRFKSRCFIGRNFFRHFFRNNFHFQVGVFSIFKSLFTRTSHTITNVYRTRCKDHVFVNKIPINNLLSFISHNNLTSNVVPKCKVSIWREDNLNISQVRSSMGVSRKVNNLYFIRIRKFSVRYS